MRKTLLICFLILTGYKGVSQVDTLVLSYEECLAIILQNHPAVDQGQLLLDRGDASVLEAKGGFDPLINANLLEKKFKNDPYYRLFNSEIEIPTKTGVKVTAGYDRTSGVFLNPENLDPEEGLIYAGVNIPLARGLLFDKRRAQLQKAELIRQASIVERRQLLNDLTYEAGIAYWNWWLAYEQLSIFEDAVTNASVQLQGVRESALAGDRAFIDTIEAGIQYQNLNLQRTQAFLNYAMSTLQLSTFLWDDNGNPQIIQESTIPASPPFSDSLNQNLQFLLDTTVIDMHPEIIEYDLKIEQLQLKKRLAKENMKPDVNLKYNFLVDAGNSIVNSVSTNNFNLGLSVQMPLFFRTEKGNLQRANIDIADNVYARSIKRTQLTNKFEATLAKWNSFKEQYDIYAAIVEDYRIMLDGELELFSNGESSQFFINSRQAKYIESQLRLKELYTYMRISEIESYYTAGVLPGLN